MKASSTRRWRSNLAADRIVIVLASRSDAVARALVERWEPHGARLLTPDDLSMAGWRYRPGEGMPGGQAVVEGRPLAMAGIGAVITRLPAIFEHELPWIVPDDREYVAAEMTAFLLAWLAALPCLVVNRPTAACLAGPLWRPERWVHTAAELGIPVTSVRRKVAPGKTTPSKPTAPGAVVTLVGGEPCGSADPLLANQARRLAAAAGADLLAVEFSGPGPSARFSGAHPWPDIADPVVADALLAYARAPRGAPLSGRP